MHSTRFKILVAIVAAVVVIGVGVSGRHLLTTSGSSPAATKTSKAFSGSGAVPVPPPAERASDGTPTASASANKSLATPVDGAASPAGTGTSGAPVVPAFAVTPQIVHTATIDMRVGKGKLDAVLRSVATVAAVDGGFVDSSSVSGGTPRRSPIAGTSVIRVADTDFADAIKQLTGLGTVENQRINGKDVTVQEAENTASLTVLQDEVTLLEKKLTQTSDLNTFLQIEGQLVPVEQQLQRLQSAQAVLQNSAAMATITIGLSVPGVPLGRVGTTPPPHAQAAAITVAWRYLRHNSLAVLDALAVGIGWALPVLVLLALLGAIALWVLRRRRATVASA
jgi:hypothetical protein